MTIDQVRSLQGWLVKIHDYATARMDASAVHEHRVQLSRLRTMCCEALDHPNAERLERIREGKANE